jgi:hypothetical protein
LVNDTGLAEDACFGTFRQNEQLAEAPNIQTMHQFFGMKQQENITAVYG